MKRADRVVEALLAKPALARDVRNLLNERKFAYPWHQVGGGVWMRQEDGVTIIVRLELREGFWRIKFVEGKTGEIIDHGKTAEDAKSAADQFLHEQGYVLIDTPHTRPKIALQWRIAGAIGSGKAHAWVRIDTLGRTVAKIERNDTRNTFYWAIFERPSAKMATADGDTAQGMYSTEKGVQDYVDEILTAAGWTLTER